MSTAVSGRLTVGIVKFASCDGCQLSLLDLEDELLDVVGKFDIIEFPEASSSRSSGPYDVLLVEGAISTDDQLREMFGPHGTVQTAQVITDRDTGRSKGFGFVEMGSDREAEAAIAGMNGQMVDGRALTVNEAKPKESRPRTGGGYGGGSRGGYGGGRS